MEQKKHIKIFFYLLSMFMFFVIVAILGTDIPVCLYENAEFIGVLQCMTSKGIMIPFVCLLMLLISVTFCIYLRHRTKGTLLGPITINSIENANSDILAFVGAYFLPLVSFSLAEHWQHLLVLLILFVVIGVIYVRADIYYTNPTLLLLGFRVYKIQGKFDGRDIKKIIIIHGSLAADDIIKYIVIDKNTYYAKKIN